MITTTKKARTPTKMISSLETCLPNQRHGSPKVVYREIFIVFLRQATAGALSRPKTVLCIARVDQVKAGHLRATLLDWFLERRDLLEMTEEKLPRKAGREGATLLN